MNIGEYGVEQHEGLPLSPYAGPRFGAKCNDGRPFARTHHARELRRGSRPESRAARVGDDIVGFTLIFPEQDGETVLIVRLLIDEKFQRRGYGRALVAAIIDWIGGLEPRRKRMRISAKPENTVALALYRSFGFAGSGIEHGEIVLWRDL